jgi:hypothetical protein
MTPKEKAVELLEKINNGKITKEQWDNCSEYARNDLKRKAIIVIDEVVSVVSEFDNTDGYAQSRLDYYHQIKTEIEKL